MQTWSHYKLRTRVEQLAKRSNVHFLLGTEEYTSKTCSRCGFMHQKLGGRETFVCPACSFTTNRDWQGAFSILCLNASRTQNNLRVLPQ
jgi:putative transposase